MSSAEQAQAQASQQSEAVKRMRQRIAEMILDGRKDNFIVSQLTRANVTEDVAQQEIATARSSPYLQAGMRQAARARKRTWVLDSLAKLHRMRPEAEGIMATTPEHFNPQVFFKHFYTTNTPLMIRGLTANWPAMSKWSLDYFDQKLGEREVEIQTNRESNSTYELQKDKHSEIVPFSSLTSRLRETESSNDFYLTAYNTGVNGEALAPLREDIGDSLHPYITSAPNNGFFWMGPKGTLTPFHHDMMNIFLTQIIGRKRVVLVPSYEIGRMRNHRHCFSEWATRPELIMQLPEDQRPNMVETELGPGDVLFIPVGWWHFVEGLDMTVGMSFNNFRVDNEFSSFYSTNGLV